MAKNQTMKMQILVKISIAMQIFQFTRQILIKIELISTQIK